MDRVSPRYVRRCLIAIVVAVLLALGSGVATGAGGRPVDPAAFTAQGNFFADAPQGSHTEIPLYTNPISFLAYELRKRRGVNNPDGKTAQGRRVTNENNQWRNAAVGFVDITEQMAAAREQGLSEELLEAKYRDKYGEFRVFDVAALTQHNPGLAAALTAVGLTSEVKTILVAPALNTKSLDHSEVRIMNYLRAIGLTNKQIEERMFALYTERSPCPKCSSVIPPRTNILFSVGDKAKGRGTAISDALRKENERQLALAQTPEGKLKRQQEQEEKRAREVASLMARAYPDPCPNQASWQSPSDLPAHPLGVQLAARTALVSFAANCAAPRPTSPLAAELGQPDSAPGGIDFSTLSLRYVADTGAKDGLGYAFSASAAGVGADTDRNHGLQAAVDSSNAFFVWLELPPSRFWVNLNPTEPDRIMDTNLGHTDAGRILLQADLQMKKTVGKLIHPDGSTGERFWKQINGACMSFRTWIVPSPATVHEDGSKLYILKAPLSVQMESQYLQLHKKSAVSCPKQPKSIQDHNEKVFRSLILPRLIKAINTAPEYADLRRVYLSRVAAEWYRQLSGTRKTTYGDLINQGDISEWRTKSNWKPIDTFHDYVDSYTKGEFHVTHRTRQGNTVYTNTYVYGGVDFSRVPFSTLNGGQFTSHWPALADSVDRSMTRPAADTADGQILLGGERPDGAGAPKTPRSKPIAKGADPASSGWRWLLTRVGGPLLLIVLLVPSLAPVIRARRRYGGG